MLSAREMRKRFEKQSPDTTSAAMATSPRLLNAWSPMTRPWQSAQSKKRPPSGLGSPRLTIGDTSNAWLCAATRIGTNRTCARITPSITTLLSNGTVFILPPSDRGIGRAATDCLAALPYLRLQLHQAHQKLPLQEPIPP